MTDLMEQTRYKKRWALARAQGIPTGFVPADQFVPHLRRLVDLDCSVSAVANAVGMSTSGLAHILNDDYPTVRQATARRLETVTFADVLRRAQSHHFLPRWAAARRIHALHALGHSHAAITAHLRDGLRSTNVTGSTATGPYLRAHTWRDVDRVYRLLEATPGSSDLSRQRALAAGHQPPLAWFDIDEPDLDVALGRTGEVVIDLVAVERALDGHYVDVRLTRAEQDEAIARGLARGLNQREIAQRIGLEHSAVTKRVTRARARKEVAA